MKRNEKDFVFIEDEGALYDFYEKNKNISWFGF